MLKTIKTTTVTGLTALLLTLCFSSQASAQSSSQFVNTIQTQSQSNFENRQLNLLGTYYNTTKPIELNSNVTNDQSVNGVINGFAAAPITGNQQSPKLRNTLRLNTTDNSERFDRTNYSNRDYNIRSYDNQGYSGSNNDETYDNLGYSSKTFGSDGYYKRYGNRRSQVSSIFSRRF